MKKRETKRNKIICRFFESKEEVKTAMVKCKKSGYNGFIAVKNGGYEIELNGIYQTEEAVEAAKKDIIQWIEESKIKIVGA